MLCSLDDGWFVGCFGLNGPLRQYFSLYRAVSQTEEESSLDEAGCITRASHIRARLFEHGFGYVWVANTEGGANCFDKVVKQRINNISVQNWKSRLEVSLKANHYKHFNPLSASGPLLGHYRISVECQWATFGPLYTCYKENAFTANLSYCKYTCCKMRIILSIKDRKKENVVRL